MLRAHPHINSFHIQITPLTLEWFRSENNFLVDQICVYEVLDRMVARLDRFQHTMGHGTPEPPIHVSKFITYDNNMLERLPVTGIVLPYRGI